MSTSPQWDNFNLEYSNIINGWVVSTGTHLNIIFIQKIKGKYDLIKIFIIKFRGINVAIWHSLLAPHDCLRDYSKVRTNGITTHLFAIMQILIENHWKVRKWKLLILLAIFHLHNYFPKIPEKPIEFFYKIFMFYQENFIQGRSIIQKSSNHSSKRWTFLHLLINSS